MTLFQGGTKLPAWPKIGPIDGTKYLAFADWEDALNPARKIVPDVIQILKF